MLTLIVEDENDVRSYVKKTMESVCQVVEARDGKEALDMLIKIPDVDLALVDWNMPRMDGYDFVKAVRHCRMYDKIPIMMMTSKNEISSVQDALNAGVNEYIMKPFRSDMLFSKVKILGFNV